MRSDYKNLSSQMKVNKQREAILRFYCAITNQDFDYVVQEYLGRAPVTSNKLYTNVEATINMLEETRGCVDCGELRCESCERLWQS